jgi:hypothetical protein
MCGHGKKSVMAEDQQTGTAAVASGRAWLARMPRQVAAQRDLLRYLVDAAEAEPAFRWVELGGSLARDAGDELSDIDAGLGIADSDWPAAVALVEQAITRAGPITDSFRQPFAGKDGASGWHLFTLYESGLQLSLVVLPSSWRPGLPPLSVALYDADGQLARPWTPDTAQASQDSAREWACLGWLALGDLAKYLDRGSAWEARARLEEARGEIWKLWAVAICATYPGFGLTSVLDTRGGTVPDGIDATTASLEPAALLDAALAAAGLLDQVTGQAQRSVPFDAPAGLQAWARARLASVRPA